MQLKEIVNKLNLEIINKGDHLDSEVSGGYVGDLLSDVMVSGKKNDVWVTIQKHENIIAVAAFKDMAGIILSKNSQPLEETLRSAKKEKITLLRSPLTSYEIVSMLNSLGIPGKR
jgi:serine kinase of HPr protein (carbohydrate metabolism regulator)